jgi:hypothetical protein
MRSTSNDAPQRTELQRRASRHNGARSRGPATSAGKAQSRRNSQTHGLYAQKVQPPADAREHDEIYEYFHQRLVEEFTPEDFTAEAAVAELATLYVQAVRVNQLIEAAQKPELNDRDARKWQQLKQLRSELALVDDAIERCQTSEPFYYAQDHAEQLAAGVSSVAEHIFHELAVAESEEGLSSEEMDDQEIQELRQLEELGRLLRPARRRMQDRSQLTQLFLGDRPSKRGELKKIRVLLEHRRQELQDKIDDRQDIEEKARVGIEQKTAELAHDSDELHRLLDLKERVDRSIHRVLKRLNAG